MVQLSRYNFKNLIMESLFKLKHSELKFRQIVIAHDMTKAERDECKKISWRCKSFGNRWTDRRTDRFAISTSHVSILTRDKNGAWRNEVEKPWQHRVCTVDGHKTCSCSVDCICCYWYHYGKSTTERWIHQSDKLSSAGCRVHCTHGWSGSLWSEDSLLRCKQAI